MTDTMTTTTTTAYLLAETQADDTDGARIFPIVHATDDGPVLLDPLSGEEYHPIPAELADGIPLDARAVELIELYGRTVAADTLRDALDRLP